MAGFRTDDAFSRKLWPAAERIYKTIWPGCSIEDLRVDGKDTDDLDRYFAIDKKIVLADGTIYTLQEKYRRFKFLKDARYRVKPGIPDFTQEYMNAVGTPHQAPGEWFHLAAQFYFYGWANQRETDFAKWFIMSVPEYRMEVYKAGGLDAIGRLSQNSSSGNRASFYAIPADALRPAWRYTGSEHGETMRWSPDNTGVPIFDTAPSPGAGNAEARG